MTTIKRVGIFSLGKVMGFTGFLMGLLAACFYALVFFGLGASVPQGDPGATLLNGIGAAVIIVLPVVYGLMSFLVGLVYGVCANVVLAMSGGLEVELAD